MFCPHRSVGRAPGQTEQGRQGAARPRTAAQAATLPALGSQGPLDLGAALWNRVSTEPTSQC